MLVAFVYSIWAYWWAMKYTKFKWVQRMICLCMVSLLQSAYSDAHDEFRASNPDLEWVM